MQQPPGERPIRKKMALPEWIVVIGILGVLLAILLPALREGAKRGRQQTHPSSENRPQADAWDGQGNIIEPPGAQAPKKRAPRSPRGSGGGGIISLIIWAAALIAMCKAFRRARAKHRPPPPPDPGDD